MIRDDTRGVSIAVSHTMMLGITAILVSGLLLSAGSLLQTQEDRVAQQQADEIGADVLSHLDTLDRLNASGDQVTTTIRLEYPERIAGEPYTLEFAHESGPFQADWTLQIRDSGLDRTVYYPIPDDISVVESSARGAEPQLRLCSGGTITLEPCS